MLILAFDTSGMYGSVALLDGPTVLAEQALPTDRRSAQTLASAIVEILASQGIEPRQIQLVATTTGPGSFTGLRVGVTAAKTFAYAIGAEAIGVSTLAAVAHNCQFHKPGPNPVLEIHAIIDAQRKELFVGRFAQASNAATANDLPALTRLAEDHIISASEWLTSLNPGTIVAGAGIDRVREHLPEGIVLDTTNREPRAAIVGQLAFRDYQAGRRDDLWKLAPIYLRPSYAEEKAAKSTPPTSA